MNKIFTFIIGLFITTSVVAQLPEKMSFQAVIRDANSKLVTTAVGMQISIVQGTFDGTIVYSETHTPLPNINGLVSLEIGMGNVTIGDFKTIIWANGPYFLKNETDLEGDVNYTISGTSQLLSVPYAFHAKTAETVENIMMDGSDLVFDDWDKNVSDDFDGDYNNLSNIPVLPTKISDLTNDVSYLTTDQNTDADPSNEIQTIEAVLLEGSNAEGNSILNVNQLAVGTASPNANAAIDINSTTKALLLPRMTTSQRDLISPTEGMVIYNSELGKFQGFGKSLSSTSLLENTEINEYRFYVGDDYLWTGQSFQFESDISIQSVTFYANTINTSGDIKIEIYELNGFCDGSVILGEGTANVAVSGSIMVTFDSPIVCPSGKEYAFRIIPVGNTAMYLDCNSTNPISNSKHVYFFATSPRCNVSGSDLKFSINGINLGGEWIDFH